MPNLNLQELKLRDYRCFESLAIDFHPQLTVLVAANGAGKTSILDAIAVAFGPYIGAPGADHREPRPHPDDPAYVIRLRSKKARFQPAGP